MNSNTRKLSVIIPYKDVEEYIEECLDSVTEATKKIDSEIFLVNDFSNDGSEAIVLSYADNYPNIIMLSCEKDTRGPGAARNLALEHASGEYIAFVDADDVVLPNIYTDAINSIEHHNSDISICDVSRYKNGRQTYSIAQNRAFSNVSSALTSMEESPDLIYGSLCWNTVHRRSFLRDNDILFPEDVFYEDFVFCFKVIALAERISIIRSVNYLWRIRDNDSPSITQSYETTENFSDRYDMNRQVMEYCLNHPHSEVKRRALLTKAALLLPTTALNSIDSLSDGALLHRVRAMKEIAEQYFDDIVFNEIPIIWAQIWSDIVDENLSALREDCSYRKSHYYKVPIFSENSSSTLVLNDEIIRIGRRDATSDFRISIPVCFIRSCDYKDSVLSLSGELFFPRVSVPFDPKSSLKAWFYNVITGDKYEMPRRVVSASILTELRGSFTNPDDGLEYHCDYDGCGFQIDIDAEKVLSEIPSGKYLVMLEYYSPVKSGSRILRGISGDVIKILNGSSYLYDSRILKMDIDERQTLQISVTDQATERDLRSKYTEIGNLEKWLQYYSKINAATISELESVIKEHQTEIGNLKQTIEQLENTADELQISLNNSNNRIKQIRSSWTFRIGKAVAWLPRKIRTLYNIPSEKD